MKADAGTEKAPPSGAQKEGVRRGFLLGEVLVVVLISAMVLGTAGRLYIAVQKEYVQRVNLLRDTNYAYFAFETIKRDLYTNTDAVHVVGNVVYITKHPRVNGRYIKLYMKENKLRYTFGTQNFSDASVFYLCYGLEDFRVRQVGSVLFLRLTFRGVEYERAFRTAW